MGKAITLILSVMFCLSTTQASGVCQTLKSSEDTVKHHCHKTTHDSQENKKEENKEHESEDCCCLNMINDEFKLAITVPHLPDFIFITQENSLRTFKQRLLRPPIA
jgi:hypothetical protein